MKPLRFLLLIVQSYKMTNQNQESGDYNEKILTDIEKKKELLELVARIKALQVEETEKSEPKSDMESYKFWNTQPVTKTGIDILTKTILSKKMHKSNKINHWMRFGKIPMPCLKVSNGSFWI